jgi:uncharacterized protein YndB with AHSA1/START domain
MSKPQFVYTTYIRATPQRVFDALVDPELTKDYWGRHRNRSDWKPGSRWTHEDYDDAARVDIAGTVVERTPPKRLVVTWAFPADEGQPAKTSRVTYDVEPFGDVVRLRLTHEDLEPGSPMLDGISEGWPMVLASLKTLLETGTPIPMMQKRWAGPPA